MRDNWAYKNHDHIVEGDDKNVRSVHFVEYEREENDWIE